MTQASKQPDWEPDSCYSYGFSDSRGIAKHGEWACNVCGAAQFKPKTLEEIKVQKQSEAREDLASAIACWGRANNRSWNPIELRGVTETVEQFLLKREFSLGS